MSPRKAVIITCVVWFITAFILCNILYHTGYNRGFAEGKEVGMLSESVSRSELVTQLTSIYDQVVQKQIDRALVAENALKAMKVNSMEDLMKYVIATGKAQGIDIEITYSQKYKKE